ncbi:MAG: hypothetical protein FWD57_05795, partial [Polyangiaceae bacterium]|nr:hypothetical protein [Polyangiaceae bacterium]
MRASCLLASALAAVAIILSQSQAFAEPMDPALERLVLNPGCHQTPGRDAGSVSNVGAWNPLGGAPGDGRCLPDNVAFTRLVNQFGGAIAPTAMYTARTTGYAGLEIAIEGSFTNLDSGADYMRNGTRGKIDPNTQQRSLVNDEPDSVAQTYYLKVRKGLLFGFETTGVIGTMAHTSFIIIGADLKLVILEGLNYLLDLSGAGGVRTITGTPQL